MSILPNIKGKLINNNFEKDYKLKWLIIMGSLFITSVIVTNIIGVKIMTIWNINFTAGVITYGLVFLCTDVIGEIWGRKTAHFFVLVGFLCSLVMLGFVSLAIVSPPASFWDGQEAYSHTLGLVNRIVFASMIAYLISQNWDVWFFDLWRKKTKGKQLWLRNNLSTITSQLLDTVVFVSIAFFGIIPLGAFFSVIIGQYFIKLLIALIDTPIIYLVIRAIGGPVVGAHDISKK